MVLGITFAVTFLLAEAREIIINENIRIVVPDDIHYEIRVSENEIVISSGTNYFYQRIVIHLADMDEDEWYEDEDDEVVEPEPETDSEDSHTQPKFRPRSLQELKHRLGRMRWLYSYQRGVFDCSNTSALLWYILNREGYQVNIVGDHRHAWLIVSVNEGWVPIETITSPPTIMSNRHFTVQYETLEEARGVSPSDYSWDHLPAGKPFLQDGPTQWTIEKENQ